MGGGALIIVEGGVSIRKKSWFNWSVTMIYGAARCACHILYCTWLLLAMRDFFRLVYNDMVKSCYYIQRHTIH